MQNKKLSLSEIMKHKSTCHVIIVGTDQYNEIFCYEREADIAGIGIHQIKVSLSDESQLKRLADIHLVEISTRDRGVPYFTLVDVLDREVVNGSTVLTLGMIDELQSNDNRKFPRIQFPNEVPIVCSIVGVRGKSVIDGISFEADMIDLSAGGLSFITKVKLFHPLYLHVKFRLPNMVEPFEAYGQIARISPFHQGLHRVAFTFSEISEQSIRKINDYCIDFSETRVSSS